MRGDRGLATLETTLMITVLVPLLFAAIELGDAFQRWLAQESVTVQVARYAAEIGGDGPEVRRLLAESLTAAGVDPAKVVLDIQPPRVGGREPLTGTVRASAPRDSPFLLHTALPLRTTAVVRGELNR